jgi:hypothetical protein
MLRCLVLLTTGLCFVAHAVKLPGIAISYMVCKFSAKSFMKKRCSRLCLFYFSRVDRFYLRNRTQPGRLGKTCDHIFCLLNFYRYLIHRFITDLRFFESLE